MMLKNYMPCYSQRQLLNGFKAGLPRRHIMTIKEVRELIYEVNEIGKELSLVQSNLCDISIGLGKILQKERNLKKRHDFPGETP